MVMPERLWGNVTFLWNMKLELYCMTCFISQYSLLGCHPIDWHVVFLWNERGKSFQVKSSLPHLCPTLWTTVGSLKLYYSCTRSKKFFYAVCKYRTVHPGRSILSYTASVIKRKQFYFFFRLKSRQCISLSDCADAQADVMKQLDSQICWGTISFSWNTLYRYTDQAYIDFKEPGSTF